MISIKGFAAQNTGKVAYVIVGLTNALPPSLYGSVVACGIRRAICIDVEGAHAAAMACEKALAFLMTLFSSDASNTQPRADNIVNGSMTANPDMGVALTNAVAAHKEVTRLVAAHTPLQPRKWDVQQLMSLVTDPSVLDEFFTDMGHDLANVDMGSVKARHTAWFYLLRIGLYTDIYGDVQKIVGYLLALNIPDITMPIEELAHNDQATNALCWLLSSKDDIDRQTADRCNSLGLPDL
jgi:hypothetical protein